MGSFASFLRILKFLPLLAWLWGLLLNSGLSEDALCLAELSGSTLLSLQTHQHCRFPHSSRESERPPSTRRIQEEEIPERTGELSRGVGADWGGETLLFSPLSSILAPSPGWGGVHSLLPASLLLLVSSVSHLDIDRWTHRGVFKGVLEERHGCRLP